MIYHQFVTIRTLLNKVCYGFQHILATWCIHWSRFVFENDHNLLKKRVANCKWQMFKFKKCAAWQQIHVSHAV